MTYYKITNEKENHHGFQYKNGLNILIEPFNDDLNSSCCSGGFYFTNIKNILNFTYNGYYIREVFLPENDFKIIKDPMNDRWRSNKIILGKRYNLWEVETFELLIRRGADIKGIQHENLLYNVLKSGNHRILIFLLKNGLNLCIKGREYLLYYAYAHNYIELIKFLKKI